ncbi:MAG: MerR family transcriptional regulator [Dehalococcoidia bacterium]
MAQEPLTIKQAATATRLDAKTIRYYEEIGLIPPIARNPSRYRVFSEKDLRRLHMIRRTRLLGLSLPEIKEVLRYAEGEECGPFQRRMLDLVQKRLEEITERIRDLEQAREDLVEVKKVLAEVHLQEHPEGHVVMECVDCRCFGEPVELVLPGAKADTRK